MTNIDLQCPICDAPVGSYYSEYNMPYCCPTCDDMLYTTGFFRSMPIMRMFGAPPLLPANITHFNRFMRMDSLNIKRHKLL